MSRFDTLGLAQMPEVQKALKLTDDEKAFVKLLAEDIREQDREFNDLPREERFAKFRERMQNRSKEVTEQLTEIVGEERGKRLNQIRMQLMGPMALFMPGAADSLNISEEQRDQIRQAMREVEEEMRDLVRQKQLEKLHGILDSDQKAKWKEIIGAPIDFKITPPRRDRRGGRGGERNGEGGRPRRPST